ncbi:MAG: DUF1232 domain-containing protein [Saprospiraceae bacterium]|nr:DUF1232 domain-containing protein [Saprospiraceae bacterium]
MKLMQIFSFLGKRIKSLGTRLVYTVLLMVYAYHSEKTPKWAKRIILGSIAYLLSPLDSIPDLTPVFGFTDDLGVLSFGLVAIACYIDEEVRAKARAKLLQFYRQPDLKELKAIDDTL